MTWSSASSWLPQPALPYHPGAALALVVSALCDLRLSSQRRACGKQQRRSVSLQKACEPRMLQRVLVQPWPKRVKCLQNHSAWQATFIAASWIDFVEPYVTYIHASSSADSAVTTRQLPQPYHKPGLMCLPRTALQQHNLSHASVSNKMLSMLQTYDKEALGLMW